MRHAIFLLPLLAACSGEIIPANNPFGIPATRLSTPAETAAYQERRGRVEVIVKSNYPAILSQIEAGDGPALGAAIEAARIPEAERPARLIQLRADLPLYRRNPSALVSALMIYGR